MLFYPYRNPQFTEQSFFPFFIICFCFISHQRQELFIESGPGITYTISIFVGTIKYNIRSRFHIPNTETFFSVVRYSTRSLPGLKSYPLFSDLLLYRKGCLSMYSNLCKWKPKAKNMEHVLLLY